MEVIPHTLAENAGLNPISVVTELRRRHAQNEPHVGINVRKGCITDIRDENVWQTVVEHLVRTYSINRKLADVTKN